MGAACCIASRDKNIHHGASGEFLHRNFRHSPTWSFRWDNRVGVVAEEASSGWLSDVANRNDTSDVKSLTDVSAQVSDGGNSMESYRIGGSRKSPLNQAMNKSIKISASGQYVTTNDRTEVKQCTESPQVSDRSAVKLSPLIHTSSSLTMSPLSSQTHPPPPSPTPSRWTHGSPAHQLAHQVSDTHSSARNSPSNNSVSEEGQVPDQWSVDSDSLNFSCDEWSRTSCHDSRSVSVDFRTCGICSKLLCERSACGSHAIIGGAELSVVSVLVCGHVYHAECLETITPEIYKYDPACPVCTLGKKQTLKLTGKMFKAEKDFKAKSIKKSRNQVGDTNASIDFDYWKKSVAAHEGKNPKLVTSSSLKISGAKPFFKRHFPLGSKGNKSSSESMPIRKKGLFWAKSSRE